MSITRTAVSYYNLGYVEHAEADFREMLDHGCTTVILAVTEFDFDFWRPNIPRIVEAAHRLGLRAWREPGLPGRYCPESAALAIAAAFQKLRKGGNEDA